MTDLNTVTTVEQDGRTLSGMGADAGQLESVMDRHAPEPETPAGTAVPAADGGAAPAPAAEPPQLAKGRQRYSDLTKERDAAAARAEAAERERDELKARVAAPPVAAVEPPKPAAAPAKPADKFTFPPYDEYFAAHPESDYNTWEIERLQAFSDWKDAKADIGGRIEQGIAARDAARQTQALIAATHVKGRESYKDFDAVLTSGPGATVDLAPDATAAAARVRFIYDHPQSEHLQYAIMKDADLAKKLAGLDDIGFGLEIARLVTPQQAARPRAVAPPPAPYMPVNSGSATTVTPSSELAGKGYDYDRSGYREKRAAERKAARR